MRTMLALALILPACTGAAPSGPAENAAPPCEFERDVCQGCSVKQEANPDGDVVFEWVKSSAGATLYTAYISNAGQILEWHASEENAGCWPGAAVAWYSTPWDPIRCWNREGVEYPCAEEPPVWKEAVLAEFALSRPTHPVTQ